MPEAGLSEGAWCGNAQFPHRAEVQVLVEEAALLSEPTVLIIALSASPRSHLPCSKSQSHFTLQEC